MRIALNASIVDPLLSGLGTYTVHLFMELAKLHEDLVVYTSCPETFDVCPSKLRRISRQVQPFQGRRGHFYRLAWMQTCLALRLLADKVSLLLSPLPEGMVFPTVPQMVVVHDLIPLYFPEAFPRQYYYFRYVVPAILKSAAIVIADSENTKRDIVTMYGLDSRLVHVVPAGYDQGRYNVGIDAKEVKETYGLDTYLLYVGNLLPHKNLQQLLRAFEPISKTFSCQLVLAGRKDLRYYPALEAETKVLGLEGRVVFLDYVSPGDLPGLYAGAEAFVFPSLYEGFGLPILEAMACGTPVISSHTSSLPEVAGNAALLIDPFDHAALAGAMEAVLGNPGMREEMRRKGIDQAKRFSWGGTARRILEILREVGDR